MRRILSVSILVAGIILPVFSAWGGAGDMAAQSVLSLTSGNTGDDVAVDEYRGFLNALPLHDYESIPKAVAQYGACAGRSKDKGINDRLFEVFKPFYYMVHAAIIDEIADEAVLPRITEKSPHGAYYEIKSPDRITDRSLKKTAEALSSNGFAAISTEEGLCLDEDPTFLYDLFKGYVSEGLSRYLEIRSNEMQSGPVIGDAALLLSWDEVAERMLTWEDYNKAFPDSPEAEEANDWAGYYLSLYLVNYSLDNTPMFIKGILSGGLRSSYERFIKNNKDSAYLSVVSGYYNILKGNGLAFNSDAGEFLKKNGIERQKAGYEENTVAKNSLYAGGKVHIVSIVMTDGDLTDDAEPGPFQGWHYEGRFVLKLKDKEGTDLSVLDLNKAFGRDSLIFGTNFNIEFEDYNSDGNPDLAIGQYSSSNGYIYGLFTITTDQTVKVLPVADKQVFFSSMTGYSTVFNRPDSMTFIVLYYDNSVGKSYESYYTWTDNGFVLAKKQEAAE